jgi:hypothetical protein
VSCETRSLQGVPAPSSPSPVESTTRASWRSPAPLCVVTVQPPPSETDTDLPHCTTIEISDPNVPTIVEPDTETDATQSIRATSAEEHRLRTDATGGACGASSSGDSHPRASSLAADHRRESCTSAFSLSNGLGLGLGKNSVDIGGILFTIQLHCTRRDSLADAISANKETDYFLSFVHQGRCDIAELIAKAHPGPDTIAAACGPPSLALEVSETAWEHGCDFHAEQFAF